MNSKRSLRRRVKEASERAEPGVAVWQSYDEVRRARRNTAWVASGLGALGLLMLTGVSGGGDAVLGVVILEVFIVVPLVLALMKLRRFNKALRQMRTADGQDEVDDLRLVDEALFRISRLAGQLEGEVAQAAGLDSVAAADRAGAEWRQLVTREHDIERILDGVEGTAARASLERSLTLCRQDAATFRAEVEDLAAALAELVDASDDMPADDALLRVRAARERMEALAASFREVNALADASMRSPG